MEGVLVRVGREEGAGSHCERASFLAIRRVELARVQRVGQLLTQPQDATRCSSRLVLFAVEAFRRDQVHECCELGGERSGVRRAVGHTGQQREHPVGVVDAAASYEELCHLQAACAGDGGEEIADHGRRCGRCDHLNDLDHALWCTLTHLELVELAEG